MSATETLAREGEADDYAALQSVRDAQYLEDCTANGIEPAPNHAKQLSVNVVLPVVDRGKRNGSHLIDEPGEEEPLGYAAIDAAIDETDGDGSILARDLMLSPKLAFFLIQARSGPQMLHRFAAVALKSGFRLRELRVLWPGKLTESPLRRARADLDEFLGQQEKKTRSASTERVLKKSANHVRDGVTDA